MREEDKGIAVLLGGFVLGGGLWRVGAEAMGVPLNDAVLGAAFAGLMLPAVMSANRLGQAVPSLREWVNRSQLGLFCAAAYVGAVVGCGSCVIAALNPPWWVLASGLLVLYAYLGARALSAAMKQDSRNDEQ